MDTPYRIESYRDLNHRTVYAIMHSGVGVVAEVFSLCYARKVVDALNNEVRHAQASPPDRRLHQSGDAPLADTADGS
jgi:hypothetical protein